MRRTWHLGKEGRYYRSVLLMIDEFERTFPLRLWRRSRLLREMDHTLTHGHTTKDTLQWWQRER